MITGNQVVDICIVVTRYFGGTLLGTGGLVRAYTEAAKVALNAAGIKKKYKIKEVDITTNYNDSGKISYLLNNEDVIIAGTEYTENVRFTALIPVEAVDRLTKKITETTAARAEISVKDERFIV